MKKSLFGSILGFFLVVGLSLALSANPSDPKKTEAAKGCCSGKAKTEQASCCSVDKKAKCMKEQAACSEKKTEAACAEKKAGAKCSEKKTEGEKKSCCSAKKN